MRNFGRYYQFTFFDLNKDNVIIPLNGIVLNHDMAFSVQYGVTFSNFNVATFHFRNIDQSTRNLFTSTRNRRGFYFRSAYDNPYNLQNSIIFQGLTFRVNTYREGPDIITEVSACDPFFTLQAARIKSISYPRGTTALKIVSDVANYLAVFNSVSGSEYLTVKPIYKVPLSYSNISITKILDDVTRDNTCTWTYGKNGISILPKENHPNFSAIANKSRTRINNATGLIGVVKAETLSAILLPIDYFTQQQLNFNRPFTTATVLMRPFDMYDLVDLNVETPGLSGTYLVVGMNYSGEFRGNEWFVNLKLSPSVRSF